jgi:hypothetical protein
MAMQATAPGMSRQEMSTINVFDNAQLHRQASGGLEANDTIFG